MSLHSNLVIFKSLPPVASSLYSFSFTFQSGYIQIKLLRVHINMVQFSLHSNLVIFKSISSVVKLFIVFNLYIPIWLYSNKSFFSSSNSIYYLYIPIWLYSNVILCAFVPVQFNFTFQSGYIQICLKINAFSSKSTLHSNLVIFK